MLSVSAEIEMALMNKRANGLIIGLEKYRQLKEESSGCRAHFSGRYNEMPIIVDSTQVNRLTVY